MPIVKSTFRTHRFMRNGHLQTALPYLFRNFESDLFEVNRIDLTDGDFIDIDYYHQNSDNLVIVSHGLEGSSDRPYVRGQAHYLTKELGFDVIAWNMRSCSGEINLKKTFYHAAQTCDLDEVISYALSRHTYKRIYLVGFSLGGSLTSYYISTIGNKNHPQISGAICISSPLLLEASTIKLSSSAPGMVYTNSFLKTMKVKVLKKKKLGINDIDEKKLNACKNFLEFDELVTAPDFGFKSASHYYEQASSYPHIKNINLPTLFIQSKDDPFLTKESFPQRIAQKSSNVFLEITESGGHIGFISTVPSFSYWHEKRVADFLINQCHD
jgi:predicted alpha/beta-fold hydrolase